MNIVITGTSRGIGLELTRQALASEHQVLAVARHPEKSPELEALGQQYGSRLQTLSLDIIDPEAAAKIQAAVKNWPQVDVLINNAGVYLSGIDRQSFIHSFEVNTIAPLLITNALLSSLKKSQAPRAVHVTSLMGSIADNSSGGYYPYRASKAALNMINKSLSVDNEWLTTIVIHPGWVATDMGGKGAPTAPADSAAGIWQVTEKLKNKDSGSFFDFRGKLLPW